MNFESSEFSIGLRTYSFFALFDAKKASISLNFCLKVPDTVGECATRNLTWNSINNQSKDFSLL